MKIEQLLLSPNLPSPASTAIRLIELSGDAESVVNDYANAIRTDPALCAQILKAANSPLFGARSEINTVERAISMLGVFPVMTLAMGFSLADDSFTKCDEKECYDAFWKQSVIQAVMAECLDPDASRKQKAERFLVGLMLDIGKLAMLKCAATDYLAAVQLAEDLNTDLVSVETEVFGFDHATVGAELLKSWNLPASLVQFVRTHHDVQLASESASDDQRVAIFASAAGEYFCSSNKAEALERLNLVASNHFGLQPQQVQDLLDDSQDRLGATCEQFFVCCESIPNPQELLEAANKQLVMISMQTQQAQRESEVMRMELEQRNEKLQEQTIRDPLTGAFNRRFFCEVLEKEFARSERTNRPIGVLFMDVDHFKQINDTFGHAFGDAVLEQVVQRLHAGARKTDVVARFGGEEFVILMLDTEPCGIAIAAERFRNKIAESAIEFQGMQADVTVSIGATGKLLTDASPQALVDRADKLMYQAKREGRNTVRTQLCETESGRKLAAPHSRTTTDCSIPHLTEANSSMVSIDRTNYPQ